MLPETSMLLELLPRDEDVSNVHHRHVWMSRYSDKSDDPTSVLAEHSRIANRAERERRVLAVWAVLHEGVSERVAADKAGISRGTLRRCLLDGDLCAEAEQMHLLWG